MPHTEKTTEFNAGDIQNLSEAQRAMLKCRIHQLMINKYRKGDFFDELNTELSTDNSLLWFTCLSDFSLDDKIPQMLTGLNVDINSLFDKMSIVIKTEAAAKALSIDYSAGTIFPIIVSGNKIFPALSTLSLPSLSALESDLQDQINIKQINSDTDIKGDLINDIKSSIKTKSMA